MIFPSSVANLYSPKGRAKGNYTNATFSWYNEPVNRADDYKHKHSRKITVAVTIYDFTSFTEKNYATPIAQ